MADKQGAVGTIKLFDPATRRGVIAPQEAARVRGLPEDLYFEVDDAEQALRLRVGQLVQFVVEGSGKDAEVREVFVLSELA